MKAGTLLCARVATQLRLLLDAVERLLELFVVAVGVSPLWYSLHLKLLSKFHHLEVQRLPDRSTGQAWTKEATGMAGSEGGRGKAAQLWELPLCNAAGVVLLRLEVQRPAISID